LGAKSFKVEEKKLGVRRPLLALEKPGNTGSRNQGGNQEPGTHMDSETARVDWGE